MAGEHGVAAGWYAIDGNRNREQYWDGSSWRGAQRWRRNSTPAFPSDASDEAGAAAEVGRMQSAAARTSGSGPGAYEGLTSSAWSGFIVVLAVVIGIAVAVVGVVLVGQGHEAQGVAVLVVGLLEAAFIGSFAVLHQDVRLLRIELADLTRDLSDRREDAEPA